MPKSLFARHCNSKHILFFRGTEYEDDDAPEYELENEPFQVIETNVTNTAPKCIDMPQFADCMKLTTTTLKYNSDSYCNDFFYYSKFCCKSCTEAGLPLHPDFLKIMGEKFNETFQLKEEYREGYVNPVENEVEYENEYEYYN